MCNNALDPIKKHLIHLETFVDAADNSSEFEIDHNTRKSSPRCPERGYDRDIERCAVGPARRLRFSVRGWGCTKLARHILASALGFFIAL